MVVIFTQDKRRGRIDTWSRKLRQTQRINYSIPCRHLLCISGITIHSSMETVRLINSSILTPDVEQHDKEIVELIECLFV